MEFRTESHSIYHFLGPRRRNGRGFVAAAAGWCAFRVHTPSNHVGLVELWIPFASVEWWLGGEGWEWRHTRYTPNVDSLSVYNLMWNEWLNHNLISEDDYAFSCVEFAISLSLCQYLIPGLYLLIFHYGGCYPAVMAHFSFTPQQALDSGFKSGVYRV